MRIKELNLYSLNEKYRYKGMETQNRLGWSIVGYFKELEDSRKDINKQHRLDEIVTIALH